MTDLGSIAGDGAWRLFKMANANPVLKVVLTAALIVSFFLTPVIVNIGTEFVPIIDKPHLLAVVATYALAVLAYFKLFAVMNDFMIEMLKVYDTAKMHKRATKRGWSEDQLKSEIARRGSKIFRRVKFLGAILFVLAPLSIFFVTAYSDVHNWGDLVRLGVLVGTNLLFLIILFLGYYIASGDARYYQVAAAGSIDLKLLDAVAVSVLISVASFGAGAIWFEYQRVVAPKLTIDYTATGRPDERATIVMPAVNGIIAFVEGGREARYIPWSEVREMRARNRSIRPPQPAFLPAKWSPVPRPTGPQARLVPLLRMSVASD